MVETPANYKVAFCARLAAMRKAAGFTQEDFADKLGVSRDTYSKYESRSYLRHDLIAPAAELTNHDPCFLLTGRNPHDETLLFEVIEYVLGFLAKVDGELDPARTAEVILLVYAEMAEAEKADLEQLIETTENVVRLTRRLEKMEERKREGHVEGPETETR